MEPWARVEVQVGILSIYELYAESNSRADDVVNLGQTLGAAWRIHSGLSGKAPNTFLLIGQGLGEPYPVAAHYILKSMDIDVSVADLHYDFQMLGLEIVEREFGDGTIRNTRLTDWERFSLLMTKHGGFSPRNVIEFMRNSMEEAGPAAKDVRDLYASYGIDVDLILGLSDAEVALLSSTIRVPEELLERFQIEVKCFPGETFVHLATGTETCISRLRPNDTVLAFDPRANRGRGALVARRVKRLYRNTTPEWMRLRWVEGGAPRELVCTPGHHFLDAFGGFPNIAQMLRDGSCYRGAGLGRVGRGDGRADRVFGRNGASVRAGLWRHPRGTTQRCCTISGGARSWKPPQPTRIG
jgi:hypothetical protein